MNILLLIFEINSRISKIREHKRNTIIQLKDTNQSSAAVETKFLKLSKINVL